MSEEHSGPFAVLPASAVFDPDLSDAAFRVLAALACHAQGEEGKCYPKEGSIAFRLRRSQGAIAHQVKALCTLGYLLVARFKAEGQARPTNHYRLAYAHPKPSRSKGSNITYSNITVGNVKNKHMNSKDDPMGSIVEEEHAAPAFFSKVDWQRFDVWCRDHEVQVTKATKGRYVREYRRWLAEQEQRQAEITAANQAYWRALDAAQGQHEPPAVRPISRSG